MDYVIYTFGGGEALWKVFNGLAILFKSESGFSSVMKLSMTVGAVWAALRALWGANVGLFARDYFIPTYLILNLMLIPTTAIHIIDEVNLDFKYSKVDHVPLGIAAVASTASHLSKLLTNMLEQSLQAADANHYGKTGPLFAARLVSMARDIRIVDPVARQNLKDFVRQCFTLPFVWTNMGGKKAAALESDDILGFITATPHLWLGSYWRDSEGRTTFRHCQEGALQANAVITLETPKSLSELASGLFGSVHVDSTAARVQLNKYFGDAWQTLSHQTRTAHQMAEQEMMMNVYREGVDDKRQEFGLERLNPQLIAASSARAKVQQNSGFLVSAQMVGSMLPSLQSTMLAILCILFVIVIPMALLPGGLKTLGMWIKLILWVESWPVFYALINSVALIMASNRGASYMSTGKGLSLLTQNGLADAAYDAYCYAEGFMAIVPVIAWAVISGGGYALANLSGTVTRSVDGLSSKLGTEMTDGNLSFDNQSSHNMSVAGTQMAQQQLGSQFNYAQRYDDGQIATLMTPEGKMTLQEHQTQLKTHVSETDNLAASLSETAQHSLQASQSHSKMASESWHQGFNQLTSFAHQQSQSAGLSDGFGQAQSVNNNQDFRQAWDTTQKISQQTGLSTDKVVRAGLSLGVSTGGMLGKYLNMGASGEGNISAAQREDMSKVKDTGLQDQLSESLSRGLQHSFDHKGSLSSQTHRQAVDSIQGSFNTAESHQTQASATLTESENLSRAATLAKSNSLTSTTNWNDQTLSYVADKRFGGDVRQAARWSSDNPEPYRQDAAMFMQEKQQGLIQSLKSSHALSESQVREKFAHYSQQIPNRVDHGDIYDVQQRVNTEGLGDQGRQDLHHQIRNLREETGQGFKHNDQEINQGKENITQEQQTRTGHYQEESDKGLRKRMGDNLVKVGEGMSRQVNETLTRTTSYAGDHKPGFLNSSKTSTAQNAHLTTPPLRIEDSQQNRDMNQRQGRPLAEEKQGWSSLSTSMMQTQQAGQDPVSSSSPPFAGSSFGPSAVSHPSAPSQFPKDVIIRRDYMPSAPSSPSRQAETQFKSQPSFQKENLPSPQESTFQKDDAPSPMRQEVTADKEPVMPSARFEDTPGPNTQLDSPAPSQTGPATRGSLSQEDDDLTRRNSKIAAQGRELKQLRQMMESPHDKTSYEDTLPMPSDPLDK